MSQRPDKPRPSHAPVQLIAKQPGEPFRMAEFFLASS
jgi:hypothetical protein